MGESVEDFCDAGGCYFWICREIESRKMFAERYASVKGKYDSMIRKCNNITAWEGLRLYNLPAVESNKISTLKLHP